MKTQPDKFDPIPHHIVPSTYPQDPDKHLAQPVTFKGKDGKPVVVSLDEASRRIIESGIALEK